MYTKERIEGRLQRLILQSRKDNQSTERLSDVEVSIGMWKAMYIASVGREKAEEFIINLYAKSDAAAAKE